MKRPKFRLAPASPPLTLLALGLPTSRLLRLVEFQVAQIGSAHQLSSTLAGPRRGSPRSSCRSLSRRGGRSCVCCGRGRPLVLILVIPPLSVSEPQGILKASKSLAEATQNRRHFYYNAIFYWRAK